MSIYIDNAVIPPLANNPWSFPFHSDSLNPETYTQCLCGWRAASAYLHYIYIYKSPPSLVGQDLSHPSSDDLREGRKEKKGMLCHTKRYMSVCRAIHHVLYVYVKAPTYLGIKQGPPNQSRRHWSCPRKMSCCIVLARYGTATAGERRQAATNVGPKRKKGRSNWDFCLLFRVSRQDRTGRLSHPFPPGNQGHTSGKY